MFENTKLTPLSQFGEFALIDHLTKDAKIKHTSTIKGIGDDAAVLNYTEKQIVVTTDLLVEGVHFDLSYTPLKHLGYKSVIVNLSDVCAMNARPKQITVSIAVSSRFPVEALEELYSGIYLACEKYQIDLIGGDTTSSQTGLLISVTAIGEVMPNKVVYRNGAQVNDLICVSGDLGGAYLGLQLLEREKKIFKENPDIQPVLEGYDYILERQLKPEARIDIIELLEKLELQPTSMIDISDGLSSELLHICKQSEVGCDVYEVKVPIDYVSKKMADEFEINPVVAALNGGEDYELLFTLPLSSFDTIKSLQEFTIIGKITEKESGCQMVSLDGSLMPLKAQGWNGLTNG